VRTSNKGVILAKNRHTGVTGGESTPASHPILGWATAIGLQTICDRARSLATVLRETLPELDGVRVLDRGPELGATVTISANGWSSEDLALQLRQRGINTSSQTRIDAVMDYDTKRVDGALRISPHYYNLESELDLFADTLREILQS